jgi:hypothetical protein
MELILELSEDSICPELTEIAFEEMKAICLGRWQLNQSPGISVLCNCLRETIRLIFMSFESQFVLSRISNLQETYGDAYIRSYERERHLFIEGRLTIIRLKSHYGGKKC